MRPDLSSIAERLGCAHGTETFWLTKASAKYGGGHLSLARLLQESLACPLRTSAM